MAFAWGAPAKQRSVRGNRYRAQNRPEGVMGNQVRSRRKAPGVLADVVEFVQDLARSLFDTYRHEMHYMRGPGPKWTAKHERDPVAYRAIPALIPVRVRLKR